MEWTRYLSAGDVVVDVGANTGQYTREFAAIVGPTGAVIAMEPQAALADRLRQAGATVVITAAVSDTVGETTLYHSRETPHASLWARNVVDPTGRTEVVRQVTLDGLRASGALPGPIRLIKIDAQGADGAVLRGATQVLATDRPLIVVELWPQGLACAGTAYTSVCDWLAAHGYVPMDFPTWQAVKDAVKGDEGYASHDVWVRAA